MKAITIYDMSIENRMELNKRIEAIIGTKDSWINGEMSREERIGKRFAYDRMKEKLEKVFLEHGDKALAMNFSDCGSVKRGITPKGKRWELDMNNGWTERSRQCGTLWMEGDGVIFTSGTLAKAFEYILNA